MTDQSIDEQRYERARQVIGNFATEILRHNTCDILRLLQREGLSMPRAVTLNYLHRHGKASISAISTHLNLALNTTSHLVDQLVADGFVSRTESPDDRRHKLITLTERGLAFVYALEQARVTETVRRLMELPPTVLDPLLDLLTQALDHLGTDTSEVKPSASVALQAS